jgi:hypothetical protein
MTTLAEKQLAMKARQCRQPRPGRKLGPFSDEALQLARMRMFAFTLLSRGVSLEQTIAQVRRVYGVETDPGAMIQWLKAGFPLINWIPKSDATDSESTS